jgi:ADP-heptose:LPS heptosyltransferase
VVRLLLEAVPDLAVGVVAGPGEESLAIDVVNACGESGRVRILDDLSLDGLSELLRRAALFLGGSSGPAHLAALVRTPVVALYPGLPPLWPARWRPIGDQVSVLTPLAEEPFCPRCERDHDPENCVARIRTDRIVAACKEMLTNQVVAS